MATAGNKNDGCSVQRSTQSVLEQRTRFHRYCLYFNCPRFQQHDIWEGPSHCARCAEAYVPSCWHRAVYVSLFRCAADAATTKAFSGGCEPNREAGKNDKRLIHCSNEKVGKRVGAVECRRRGCNLYNDGRVWEKQDAHCENTAHPAGHGAESDVVRMVVGGRMEHRGVQCGKYCGRR